MTIFTTLDNNLKPLPNLNYEGFKLVGKYEVDDYYDYSYLGSFSDTKESDLSIEHKGGHREFAYFNPYEAETIEQSQMLYERALDMGEEWQPLVLIVEAYKAGVLLGTGACGGVESDMNARDLLEHYNDLAKDAIIEAKEKLNELTKGGL
jgi:hypothetical protein